MIQLEAKILTKVLDNVIPFAETRSPLPIIEQVYAKIDIRGAVFSATNMQQRITYNEPTITSEIEQEFLIGKEFYQLLKKLSGVITIKFQRAAIVVESNTGEYSFPKEDASNFPKDVIVDGVQQYEINTDTINIIAKHVAPFVSRDEYRPQMTGVNIKAANGKLVAYSTDGYQLTKYVADVDNDVNFNILIPAKPLQNVTGKGVSRLATTPRNIEFITDNATINTNLIEERFPNAENVIPQQTQFTAIVNPSDIIAAIERISMFSPSDNHAIKFTLTENKLQLKAADESTSKSASEDLCLETIGELSVPLSIGFNSKLLLPALKNVASYAAGDVALSFINPTKPMLIRPQYNDTFLHLLMPIRI